MKKNFKTKIAAGILAVTTALSANASVFAADITDLYNKMFSGSDAIDIVYNGEVLTYTDAQPQIINDRTMIPFRTVLETMGATVNYDDATRTVTAVRGTKTINFSLDATVIDIDDNGVKSQLQMDVPMAVVNDRTLVPIRFLSNALGMNVGWEADMRTVVILDSEAYLNEIKALPNIGKIMDMKCAMPVVENGAYTIALDFASDFATFDVRLDAAYDITCTNGVIGGKAAINLDIDGLQQVMSAMGEADVKIQNIENATIDVVADNGVIYFKTDLIEKIAAAYPDATEIASVAAFADKNTWFKWDIAAAVNAAAKEDPSVQPMADIINGGITGLNEMTGEDVFAMVFEREGDVELFDVTTMDAMVDAYAMMDKYINVTVEEDGDYTIAMNITTDTFIDLMKDSGLEMTDEEIAEVKKAITLEMKADSKLADGKSTAAVDYTIAVDMSAVEDTNLKMSFKISATSTGDMNATAETPKVPKTALDVMDVIEALQ